MFAAAAAAAALLFTPPGLGVAPPRLILRHADDARQLVVTDTHADGRAGDRTAGATYAAAPAGVVRVEPGGRVVPVGAGSATVTVTHAGRSVRVPVTVALPAAPLPVSFPHQVEPVLTKLGCNAGGCHGKVAGQAGFRLSLLGYDPELDFDTLVREGRGRRMFPAAPDESLFLTKATGRVPHGGGKKLDAASEEYALLRRWIAAGTPYSSPGDAALVRVSVTPAARVVERGATQQLAVTAHYADGRAEDVTRRAQYESNAPAVALVTETGLVSALPVTGQAAVMVRFNGLVATFRAAVPRPGRAEQFAFDPLTAVDTATADKWRELNIAPSGLCTDREFIRRATLDLSGALPTPADVRAFVADASPAKRAALVDRLVESPGYAALFAQKWADVLRVKRTGRGDDRAAGAAGFHDWIKGNIAADVPATEFARGVLTAAGTEDRSPPVAWLREVTTPEQFADDVSQVFLGQRLACAQCHHHPYEKWTQDDYWNLAAVFGRVGRKDVPAPGQAGRRGASVFVVKSAGGVTNKRTGRAAVPTAPGGPTLTGDADPRAQFADWLADPANPHFARAVANRYWAHFFGRGVVDPVDDMRDTNPPTNPALLDALAAELVRSGYSLKHLSRVIAKSRTYQLSAAPTPVNGADTQSFARFTPRRLGAEVLYDAVGTATGAPPEFPGLPGDRFAPRTAVALPDAADPSYFLDVAGRPPRNSACDCERVSEPSLAMALHLLNSADVQNKLGTAAGRAALLAKDPRPDPEKVRELFVALTADEPTPAQLAAALAHVVKHKADPKVAYENLLWALLNSKAFLFTR